LRTAGRRTSRKVRQNWKDEERYFVSSSRKKRKRELPLRRRNTRSENGSGSDAPLLLFLSV